jgi:serine/threonine-protein kinase
MELVEGETLKKLIRKRGALPIPEAVSFATKLARAMAYAHSRGVIHRDLKPQNVIVERGTNEPKITDFGLARIVDLETLTKTGAIMGTPAYMAPEQAAGVSDKIGEKTDVYALGMILYELLTGKVAFRKKTVINVIHQVLREDPEPPSKHRSGIPPTLEAICLACLEKDADSRLGSAMELAQELDDVARAWTDTLSTSAETEPSGSHGSLIVAALFALAGLIAAAWILLSGSS